MDGAIYSMSLTWGSESFIVCDAASTADTSFNCNCGCFVVVVLVEVVFEVDLNGVLFVLSDKILLFLTLFLLVRSWFVVGLIEGEQVAKGKVVMDETSGFLMTWVFNLDGFFDDVLSRVAFKRDCFMFVVVEWEVVVVEREVVVEEVVCLSFRRDELRGVNADIFKWLCEVVQVICDCRLVCQSRSETSEHKRYTSTTLYLIFFLDLFQCKTNTWRITTNR